MANGGGLDSHPGYPYLCVMNSIIVQFMGVLSSITYIDSYFVASQRGNAASLMRRLPLGDDAEEFHCFSLFSSIFNKDISIYNNRLVTMVLALLSVLV